MPFAVQPIASTPQITTTLRVSFLEIHNEEIKDLLRPGTDPKTIIIRENAAGISKGWSGTLKRVVWYFEERDVLLLRGWCGTLKDLLRPGTDPKTIIIRENAAGI